MKHAIACKLDGQHGALINARLYAIKSERWLKPIAGQGDRAQFLPVAMAVLGIVWMDSAGAWRATQVFSRS